jgi:uncharacterized protein (DUF58 family)
VAFESAVSLAASIADVLSRKDYIIDIFAAGEKIYKFQAGRALAHFDNILEILACVEHTEKVDYGTVHNAVLPDAGKLSALVCLMMDWDEGRREMVESLRSMGLGTRVIIVRDSEPTLSVSGEREVSWYKPGEVLEAFS